MDPEACVREIKQHLQDKQPMLAWRACINYQQWRRNGGFGTPEWDQYVRDTHNQLHYEQFRLCDAE